MVVPWQLWQHKKLLFISQSLALKNFLFWTKSYWQNMSKYFLRSLNLFLFFPKKTSAVFVMKEQLAFPIVSFVMQFVFFVEDLYIMIIILFVKINCICWWFNIVTRCVTSSPLVDIENSCKKATNKLLKGHLFLIGTNKWYTPRS